LIVYGENVLDRALAAPACHIDFDFVELDAATGAGAPGLMPRTTVYVEALCDGDSRYMARSYQGTQQVSNLDDPAREGQLTP
jgi:hypothetical protein